MEEVKTATAKRKTTKSIIKMEEITDTNILIRAAANAIAKFVNFKTRKIDERKEPY